MVGNTKQEEDEHQNDPSQREVDIKAPPPSHVRGEGASDQQT
jgi:hypothetical protein